MSQSFYSELAIKRALHTYISFKVVNLILAFVFQIIIAKVLSPSNFATYAVLLAVLMAGERALSFGIDRTILRFVPTLTRHNDIVGLRLLISKVALIRVAAMIMFFTVALVGTSLINSILPIQLGTGGLLAFGIWFVAYTFTADADAFAQSWMAHFESAFAAMLEIVFRMALLIILLQSRDVGVKDIVVICASTSSAALALVIYRMRSFIMLVVAKAFGEPPHIKDATFNPKHAPMFALANFSSTLSYLISSPPVIRIIASGGLDVIGLASFSFAQGLYISLQRVFPGLLILPTLEPIVMSQLAGDTHGDRVYSGLSALFKTELVCILAVIIVTSIAGADVIEILSRPVYAQYYYVLPILMGSLVLITSYRLFELIANTNFKQHIFFWLWPSGVLAMLAMYETVHSWGILSVLLWPIVEIILRIGLLTFILRRHCVWRAFDPLRSVLLTLCAGFIVVCLFVMRSIIPIHFHHSDLILAVLGVLVFVASLFISCPLRPPEYETLVAALPPSLDFLKKISFMLTRP